MRSAPAPNGDDSSRVPARPDAARTKCEKSDHARCEPASAAAARRASRGDTRLHSARQQPQAPDPKARKRDRQRSELKAGQLQLAAMLGRGQLQPVDLLSRHNLRSWIDQPRLRALAAAEQQLPRACPAELLRREWSARRYRSATRPASASQAARATHTGRASPPPILVPGGQSQSVERPKPLRRFPTSTARRTVRR